MQQIFRLHIKNTSLLGSSEIPISFHEISVVISRRTQLTNQLVEIFISDVQTPGVA